jgi:DUF1680 family protein
MSNPDYSMKLNRQTLSLVSILITLLVPARSHSQPTQPLTPVPIQQVVIDDAFWAPKRHVWQTVTIPDVFNKFEKDGAIRNYDRVRDGQTGGHEGPPFLDGLLCESIRGASDFLAAQRNPALEARIDAYAEHIAAAQNKDKDGFLNTATQLQEPAHRWGLNGGNDVIQHDLYNAGCVVDAGVYYYKATGKTRLLEVGTRLANHMCDVMGPAPRASMVPGHGLPEEALTRLFELYRSEPDLKKKMPFAVNEQRYLELASFWIENRGDHSRRKPFEQFQPSYDQDHMPVLSQPTLEGHAVRGTLMCAGLSALATVNQLPTYRDASVRLWENLTQKRIYITGGVGAVAAIEGFAPDYTLPNNGYLESCAAIGSGFFSRNMNLLFADGRYADELERVLYNGALCATSLKGDTYYYENPLDVRKPLARWSWHGCPCCPPMFLKIMGAMPGWIYAQNQQGIYVNLYVGSKARIILPQTPIALNQTTEYPWDGRIVINVDPDQSAAFDLSLRIPEWCRASANDSALYRPANTTKSGTVKLKVNGKTISPVEIRHGYATLHREWKRGDRVELTLAMPIQQIHAHPNVEADRGRVAIMRGPVVYCAESIDNPDGLRNLVLSENTRWTQKKDDSQLGSIVRIEGKVRALFTNSANTVVQRPAPLTLIPYYANSNRRPSEMLVWLAENPATATPQPPATIASRALPTASHCCPSDTVSALNDRIQPAASDDKTLPRFTWWDHRGTREWVQYDFDKPVEISQTAVYWWDERRIQAHCRVPKSWRILYKRNNEWLPVTGVDTYGTAMDILNQTHFDKITTPALRLEVELQPEWSGGILEWTVQ